MTRTKVFKQEKQNHLFMGELQLEKLAQEFAKKLDISLKPRPLDDTPCSYWMIGKNKDYTLDHTLLTQEANYKVIVEEIRIGQGEESWKVNVETHPGHTKFLLRYSGHRLQAEKHKKKIYQLSDEMPFELFKELLAELHVVTDSKYLEAEQQMLRNLSPNENIDVRIESLSLDDFKLLPKFIKNFYS